MINSLKFSKQYILIISAFIITAVFFTLYFYMRSDIASPEKTARWINSGALIVDVRTPEEFAAGNYKGAINIPLSELEKNLHLFGDKNGKIIVYCRTGNRSGKAKKILNENGFENVINGGGLKDMLK